MVSFRRPPLLQSSEFHRFEWPRDRFETYSLFQCQDDSGCFGIIADLDGVLELQLFRGHVQHRLVLQDWNQRNAMLLRADHRYAAERAARADDCNNIAKA